MAQLTMAASQFLDTYGLVAIFVVMLVKEIGVPVPIPSDLIMLTAAAQAAAGKFTLWEGFGIILGAMVGGGLVQYALVRRLGRPFLVRVGRYVGLSPERIDGVAATVRKGGMGAIIVSLTTPGVRIATIPACGLAELPYRLFLPGMAVGSAVFLALHFVLGYLGGPLVSAVMDAVHTPLAVFVVAFLVVGLVGWLLIHRRRAARQTRAEATLATLGDWADACCPACLALGAAESLGRGRKGGKGWEGDRKGIGRDRKG